MTLDQQVMNRIRATARQLVKLLVEQRYAECEEITSGIRLPASQIVTAITEYGRHLVWPPESSWSTINIVEIDGTRPPSFSLRIPLYTQEEGRSDLEIQATLIDHDPASSQMRVELDDILVP